MASNKEMASAHRNALNALFAVKTDFGASADERAAATEANNELNQTWIDGAQARFEERTAALNILTERINAVSARIESDPLDGVRKRLDKAAAQARKALHKAAQNAYKGLQQDLGSDDPDTIRPERRASVNGQTQRMLESRDRYESVGGPLGIPWWFIGAIHGLETGYRFDRHQHNCDPLAHATVHVPRDRPENWAAASDKSWEASARDALILKGLERWSDWSVPGALYQWERYNGFGYRKYHSNVLSPYSWSFTSRYSSGKYVADGRFDDNAVSKQCSAGAILRTLVNTAVVIVWRCGTKQTLR